jgi:cytochrome c-type biogenesis protein
VTRVDVDLDEHEVTLVGAAGTLDAARARERVEELGYRVAGEGAGSAAQTRRGWSPVELLLALALVALAGTLLFRFVGDSYLGAGSFADLADVFRGKSLAGLGLGFAFGLVVAFAPATYAIAPAVMGYITGAEATSTRGALRLSAAFVAGIVLVDVIVGAAFAAGGTAAIGFFSSRLPVWYFLAAVILAALALVNLRLWRPRLPSFVPKMREAGSAGGAFTLGVPFGLMACPGCTPLLLPVALGAATSGSVWYGAALMGAFALGRGLPLALLGVFTGAFERALGATRLVRWVEFAVGVLLIAGAAWFVGQFLRVGGFDALL